MNYSELLHDFMDGTLDVSGEDTLFSVLVNNDDLRAEFREMMAIRGAVNNDKAAFIPSVGSTKAIFGQLGFSGPVAGAALSGGLIHSMRELATRYSQGIISGAATAIATSLVFITAMSFSGQDPNPGPNKQAVQELRAHSWERVNSIPIMQGGYAESVAPASGADGTSGLHTVQMNTAGALNPIKPALQGQTPADDQAAAQPTLPHDAPESTPPAVKLQHITAADLLVHQAHPASVAARLETPNVRGINTANLISLNGTILPERYVNVSFELRGNSGYTFPETAVPTGSDPLFNNMAANVMFHWDEHFAIGAEFGQEVFSQVFEDMEHGQLVRYEQKPKIFWGGVAARYYILGDNAHIAPFVHGVFGFANVGAVGKLIAGASISPESRLRMIIGVEGSGLYFTHENRSYLSRKLGLTYGISLKL